MFLDLKSAAEEKWKMGVLGFIEPLYKDRWLPSHDLRHHLRVWRNACLVRLDLTTLSSTFYEELFLACLFHDVGMLHDATEKHGWRSKVICQEFLELQSQQLNFDSVQLLEAIEHHDDKSYSVGLDDNLVYQVLSIADDMDAFGAFGLYRYLEIYLIRGLEIEKIPRLIQENAAARYHKMCSHNGVLILPLEQITNSYKRLQHFLQPDTYEEVPQTLVHWVLDNIVRQEADPVKIFEQGAKRNDNARVRDFIVETHCTKSI